MPDSGRIMIATALGKRPGQLTGHSTVRDQIPGPTGW
jgi:hypothetical protein